MVGDWLQDLESLEAISSNHGTRRIFQHIAALHQSGRTEAFLQQLELDTGLDEVTKEALAELARDEELLLAVEDYCLRTATLH